MSNRDWTIIIAVGVFLLLLWWLVGKRQTDSRGGTGVTQAAFPTGSAGATGYPPLTSTATTKVVLI